MKIHPIFDKTFESQGITNILWGPSIYYYRQTIKLLSRYFSLNRGDWICNKKKKIPPKYTIVR